MIINAEVFLCACVWLHTFWLMLFWIDFGSIHFGCGSRSAHCENKETNKTLILGGRKCKHSLVRPLAGFFHVLLLKLDKLSKNLPSKYSLFLEHFQKVVLMPAFLEEKRQKNLNKEFWRKFIYQTSRSLTKMPVNFKRWVEKRELWSGIRELYWVQVMN